MAAEPGSICGSYNDESPIEFIRQLRRHFRSQ